MSSKTRSVFIPDIDSHLKILARYTEENKEMKRCIKKNKVTCTVRQMIGDSISTKPVSLLQQENDNGAIDAEAS